MIAGALELQMFANLARLTKDMAEAKATVERSMKGIEGAVASAKAALGALGIGLGAGYFVSLIKGSIDAADHLNDLTKSTGLAADQLSGLKLLAKQTGGDLDGMAASINKLSVNIGKEPEKFKALGLSAKDPIENFKRLSDIFVALQDPEQRAAVAATALGKSWAGAAPALAEGGKRIGEIIQNGMRLSGMTKDMGVNADEFNDQMAELNTTLGATRTKLVAEMLPGMSDIAKAMQEAAKEGGLLLTIWVGLGGAMANLLGMTDAQQLKTRLQDINDQLEVARKQLQAGTLNPAGASSNFFSFLIPDVKLRDTAVAELRKTIAALEAEKARLTPPAPAAPPGVDKAAADAAAAKAREFLKGEKEAKLAAAELLKYENALKSLMDQLGKYQNMTVEEKTVRDLQIGSLKGLTAEHGRRLIAVAQEIDAEKQSEEAAKSVTAAIEAQIAARDALESSILDFERANKTALQDLEFEATLIGKTNVDRETAIALRKIEADWAAKSGVASEIVDITEQTAAIARLNRERDRAKVAVTAGIQASNAAAALNPKIIEQIRFETTLIGLNNTEREQAIALRQLELTGIDQNTEAFKKYVAELKGAIAEKNFAEESKAVLVGMWQDVDRTAHDTFVSIFDAGKSAFDRLRDTLKNGLASLLYNLTLKPFLINIVTSSAGAGVAQSVFGTSTGGASLSSILGLGNSAANLAGGAGSGLYGTFATSGIGQSLGLSSIVPDAIGLGALEGGGALGLSGLGAGIGTALPYVGIALAAASALGLFKSGKKPASFSGGRLTGTASTSGFSGDLFGTSTSDPNQPLMNQWRNNDSSQITALLTKPVQDAFAEMAKMAEVLKLDVSGLADVTASFDLTGVGQIGAEVLPVFEQNIGTLTDSIALKLMPNIADFAQANESLTQTFVRLAAEAKAAQDALDAQRHAMDIQLLEAQGDAVAALAMKREDELAALDPTLQATQKLIYALQDQAEAANTASGAQDALRQTYKTQSGDLMQTIAKWRDAAKSLRDYAASLTGAGGTGMSYATAARQFGTVSAQARGGDLDAMGQLAAAGEAFRTASLANTRTAIDYARDIARIRIAASAAASAADDKGSMEQQQLDAMTAEVSALITINESVLTVEEAIRDLASAAAAQAAISNAIAVAKEGERAQAAYDVAKAQSDATLQKFRDVVAAQPLGEMIRQQENIATGAAFDYQQFSYTSGQENLLDRAKSLNDQYVQEFAAAYALYKAIPGHATGGIASGLSWVGEEGPELVDFASPGRVYTAEQSRSMSGGYGELVEEVRGLRVELSEIKANTRAGAQHGFDGAKILRRWDKDGIPAERTTT